MSDEVRIPTDLAMHGLSTGRRKKSNEKRLSEFAEAFAAQQVLHELRLP